ncbi:Spo0E family sporulation regulatory protein-aspartic acid phosphatase [Niallia oryzisoli]|uniref:Spo0E family sporulation regulatory protein-aspartic acid phosphatase n=1 Tax=Niallia oryzisoli TaxID=1737571 RepID=A0ABZ2CGT0_9BACI
MRDCLKENLLDMKINELKQELVQIAGETGINSSDTLNISKKLDQLIIFKLKNPTAVVEIA